LRTGNINFTIISRDLKIHIINRDPIETLDI